MENTRYAIDKLPSNFDFKLVCNLCVITSMEKRILVAGQPNRDGSPTNATVKITDTNLYVPVVTLSAENDNKLLEQLKLDLKELLNGITIDQKFLGRLEITI